MSHPFDKSKLSNSDVSDMLVKSHISKELIDKALNDLWFHDFYSSLVQEKEFADILVDYLDLHRKAERIRKTMLLSGVRELPSWKDIGIPHSIAMKHMWLYQLFYPTGHK